ncbi:MAG: CocE/NonD family hydrolase, partial [Acidimicrobiales bacterium]
MGTTKRRSTAAAIVAVGLSVALVAAGCSSEPDAAQRSHPGPGGAKATGAHATDLSLSVDKGTSTATATAHFRVQPGTEELMVSGATFHQRLSLVDADGKRLVVLKADKFGQAHFSYLPAKLAEYQSGAKAKIPAVDGYVVKAGSGYTVRNEDTDPVQVSKPFKVLGRGDNPKASVFDAEAGKIGPKGAATTWFGYLTMRDGVKLSINVRLPGPPDKGPYPTVVEYSGYGPSNPDATEPGSMIAGLLGFATVGVNMRGTGCSGGVFDVFNTAQQVDGYDMIEGIAAQPWVKDHRPGMVGLSYSGITQLYVAATQPPHLAAVTSLSVIKDPWLQQWPGGVYNGGFTKSWLNERDRESSASGTSWVGKRVSGGDTTCKASQKLREQNIDFASFGRSLVRRPVQTNDRDLSRLVSKIKVPVYLTGAWQDEQTGPQFADMLGNFTQAPVKRFTMFNGRHPDGYTPLVLTRWFEFLKLYVDKKVPRIAEGIRKAAPPVFKENFGDLDGLAFEPDRFASYRDDQYREVRAAYEAEPDVRVLFDVGAATAKPGSPVPSFTKSYEQWPPTDTKERSFYLGDDGALTVDPPKAKAADVFANDPSAASKTFFGKTGYQLLAPTWDFNWTSYAKGDG